MTPLRRVPPGRAGRVWLQHRLAVAERGAELLDQKLRILHGERQRLALLVERTGTTWAAAHREAQTWLLRGVLLAGARGVRLAAPGQLARVELTWTHTMGASYPAEATVTVSPVAPAGSPTLSAALLAARPAFDRAVEAAAEHAAAEAALRTVDAEVRRTRHRLRALTHSWIPRLGEVLTETQLALDEEEHADAVRLRWVHEAKSAAVGGSLGRGG